MGKYAGTFLSDNSYHSSLGHVAWQQSVQHLLLFQYSVSEGMSVLVQYIVVDTWFLLIIFKEDAVNVFLWLKDTHYM
jgi:hypothetical protein